MGGACDTYGEKKCTYMGLAANLKERCVFEGRGINGRITFKQILKNRLEDGVMWLNIKTSGGCCKHGNKPLGFTKCEDFFWTTCTMNFSRT